MARDKKTAPSVPGWRDGPPPIPNKQPPQPPPSPIQAQPLGTLTLNTSTNSTLPLTTIKNISASTTAHVQVNVHQPLPAVDDLSCLSWQEAMVLARKEHSIGRIESATFLLNFAKEIRKSTTQDAERFEELRAKIRQEIEDEA